MCLKKSLPHKFYSIVSMLYKNLLALFVWKKRPLNTCNSCQFLRDFIFFGPKVSPAWGEVIVISARLSNSFKIRPFWAKTPPKSANSTYRGETSVMWPVLMLNLGFGILNFRGHFSKFYVWFGGSPHACYLWVNDHFNNMYKDRNIHSWKLTDSYCLSS